MGATAEQRPPPGHSDAVGPSDRDAAWAIVAGGLLMTALFVPFTLAHGPTSVNEEHQVLGADMHRWGLFLGVLPCALISGGVWKLRRTIAADRRGAYAATTVTYVALALSAAADLAFGALGPPFAVLVLAPALLVAGLAPQRSRAGDGPTRWVLCLLGVVLTGAVVFALVPMETSDGFGGFRIFGLLAYALAGLLWAALGLVLLRGLDRVSSHPRVSSRG
jgi:hypothetical protein